MPRIFAAVCALALTATVALGGLAAHASDGPGRPPPGEVPAGVSPLLASTADGPTWSSGTGEESDGPFGFGVGLDSDFAWDLTRLDPTGYRGDLVTVTLSAVRGPGNLAVGASSAFGVPEVLIDSAHGPGTTYLQIGRKGTFRWTFDRPGAYEVDLAATVPVAGGGVARADVSYRIDVTVDNQTPRLAPSQTQMVSPAGVEAFSAAAASVPVSAAQAGQQVVIDDGHVDMGPRIVDGAWRVQLKDDSVSPIVWRELADVVLHTRDAARIEVPPGDAFAFLGDPGATVYVLPQVQQSGLVWPGWNSQDPSVLDVVPGSVTWHLTDVDGPGRFVLYLAGSFGDTEILFDTSEPLPQQLAISRNTHAHGNWAFTEPGIYWLTSQMTATSDSGAELSDTRILTIVVGDGIDPNSAFTPDPGGSGTPVTNPPGDGDAAGPDDSMDITVDAGTGGSGGGSGDGGTGLADTGIAGLAFRFGMAAALVGAGSIAVFSARHLRKNKIESYS